MNASTFLPSFAADLAPNHAEIEQCARELWTNSGRPAGRDDAIWLEAERRLISAQRAPMADTGFPHRLAPLHRDTTSPVSRLPAS